MLVTLLIFIIILGVLVYVHEFGHFIVAKLNGVKVLEFAFGFRPRLFAKKSGDTVYAVNAIPLGGYVRLYGENEAETGSESFRSKTVFQRFQVLVAGAVMNLILAWLILTVLFITGFDPIMPGVARNPFVSGKQYVEIVKVVPNSPAEVLGLHVGDIVVSVNGQTVTDDLDFVNKINALRGQLATLTLKIESGLVSQQITPRLNPPAGEGALGVGIRTAGTVRSTALKAPLAAGYETGRVIGQSLQGFGHFIKNLVVKQQVSEDVTGLIGIGALTGVTRRLGFQYLVQLIAIVSTGLGVLNLIPILPLDGGHIAALGYEKMAGRPLGEKQMGTLALVGIAFVFLLFIVVTYKDIVRFDVFQRLF